MPCAVFATPTPAAVAAGCAAPGGSVPPLAIFWTYCRVSVGTADGLLPVAIHLSRLPSPQLKAIETRVWSP